MNGSDAALAGNRLAPVTFRIGFLKLPLDIAVRALADWRRSLDRVGNVEELRGGFAENVRRLEPLTVSYEPRELVVATRNPEWVALFDSGSRGGDPTSKIGALTRSVGCWGLAITSIPVVGVGGSGPWGARQFQLFRPEDTDFLNYERGVSLVQDGQRWHLNLTGAQQDFEDLSAYERRRVTDRFTGAMLEEYCRAVGVDAFDVDFYSGPSALVLSHLVPPTPLPEYTIEQAQANLNFKP